MAIPSKVHVKRLGDRRCPECGEYGFITDPNVGEVACMHCGLIIQEIMLDPQPEWRAFNISEKRLRIRVGSPTSLIQSDKGLSTTFQPYTDAQGKALPMKKQWKMLRLRKWNTRARGDADRNLTEAMNELMRISETLHLPPSIQENAAQIYRKILDKELVRGRSIRGMVAASLYAACRLTQTPRRLKDLVKTSSCTRKEITRGYRLIQNTLDLRMPLDNSLNYVARIASKAGIDQKTQNLATKLLLKAKARKEDVGKSPAGMAGAALYIASHMNGLNVSQSLLAEAAGVTEVTIRNRYKGLDKSLGLELRG